MHNCTFIKKSTYFRYDMGVKWVVFLKKNIETVQAPLWQTDPTTCGQIQ